MSVLDAFAVSEPKTKAFVKLVGESTEEKKKVLVIGDRFDEATYRAGRNVKTVQMATVEGVNTEDLLRYNKILITQEALKQIGDRTAAPDRTPMTPAL